MTSLINRSKMFSLMVSLLLLFGCSQKNQLNLTDFVDPFIGTGGTGHTFPGATIPFGMVQLSPDTRQNGWDNCSGYHSLNPTILGFSHTHLSGTGAIDYGDILVTPMSGTLLTEPGKETNPETGYRSRFSHSSEEAKPGYYRVTLEDDMIEAEMTVTERAGFHRYTFTKEGLSHILIDLKHGLGDRTTESWVEINGKREIVGMRRSTGWAKDQVIYFVAQFSESFESAGILENGILLQDSQKSQGTDLKTFASFKFSPRSQLLVKVAISAVDVEGARKNLEKELPGWDFDKARRSANTRWKKIYICLPCSCI